MDKYKISEIKKDIKRHGRTIYDFENDRLYFNWTCSGIEFIFHGTCLMASFRAFAGKEINPELPQGTDEGYLTWPCLAIFLDEDEIPYRRLELGKELDTYLLFQSDKAETHRIKIIKLTENGKTEAGLEALYVDGNILDKEKNHKRKRIEFIGDSITCGFGNEADEKEQLYFSKDENGWMSYAAITARKLDMDYQIISSSGICLAKYKDWPHPYAMCDLYEYTDRMSEERSGRKNITRWDFAEYPSDYIVLNLGTNDAGAIFLKKDTEEQLKIFHDTYYAFIKTLRRLNGINAHIICTLGSMDYYLYDQVQEIVEEYRKENNDDNISFFKLPKISIADPKGTGGHPHVQTHKKMADALTAYINKLCVENSKM